MVLNQCDQCHINYWTYKAWLKGNKRHFCSRTCLHKWQSENIRGKNHHQYKAESHSKKCQMCGKFFDPKRNPNKYCSRKCKGLASRGQKHGRYKSEGHTYGYIHFWMQKNFGSPKICENYYCQKKSKRFEWALLRSKEYERKRENFWRLCKICHLAYDRPALMVSKLPIHAENAN